MELKGILNGGKTLTELENHGKSGNSAMENPMHLVGKEKIEALKNAIEEIKFLVTQRESLSRKITSEVEKIKIDIENFLINSTKDLTNVSADSELWKERAGLRQKQVDISELQLTEKVNCWRDVAQLKKELREKQKELSEKEGRVSMLDEILEEGE